VSSIRSAARWLSRLFGVGSSESVSPVFPNAARAVHPAVVILTGAWLLTAGTIAATLLSRSGAAVRTDRAPSGTINPNEAPWYDLTLLPRIGEAKARAIVAYRRGSDHDGTGEVFRVASDLEHVSGIGPKTVRRLAPELRFHE